MGVPVKFLLSCNKNPQICSLTSFEYPTPILTDLDRQEYIYEDDADRNQFLLVFRRCVIETIGFVILTINGVGEVKLERFGDEFLEVLCQYPK